MADLEELTKEEKKYLKEFGEQMLEGETEEIRSDAYTIFTTNYNRLKKQGKDVSNFGNYLKFYEGKV